MSTFPILNGELGFPCAKKPYLAAKRRGVNITSELVTLVAERNTGSQVVAPAQPSRGQDGGGERIHSLADVLVDAKATMRKDMIGVLIVTNVFGRNLCSEPLTDKRPYEVKKALNI